MRILYLPNEYSQQRQREKKANIYPVLMAMECEWYRKQGHQVSWAGGHPDAYPVGYYDKVIIEPEHLPFLSLPHPDREFTRSKEYDSGNYKYKPGTHLMASNTCWHKPGCTFCVESKIKEYQLRSVEDVVSELDEIYSQGYLEAFDDSGTFPTGKWLYRFCQEMSDRRFNKGYKLRLGCNLRICDIGLGAGDFDFQAMRAANFRMLLFGIESANQATLNRINKGVNYEDIIPTIKKASRAGLEPHVSIIFGFPWETDESALASLYLVHYLLRKGYAKTAQASFYEPPEGPRGKEEHRKCVSKIYDVAWSPEFWFNQIRNVHNTDDLKYLWLKIKKGLQR